jgi:hypothetical protein
MEEQRLMTSDETVPAIRSFLIKMPDQSFPGEPGSDQNYPAAGQF